MIVDFYGSVFFLRYLFLLELHFSSFLKFSFTVILPRLLLATTDRRLFDAITFAPSGGSHLPCFVCTPVSVPHQIKNKMVKNT